MGNKARARTTGKSRSASKSRGVADGDSAAGAVAPDSAHFVDPFDDRVLLAYYHEIARWHGYIRFLGLPHLRDNPDVPIHRLYVEPSISDSHIQPEQPTEDWPETTPVLQAVAASQRLVLLGDPGSGKSTLVSWIAWQLTQPGDNAWTKHLGRLVPIPMILRDMDIGRDITWEGLLDAFLALPVAKPLNEDGKGRERITDLFQRGQAMIMLDGLDEIGSTAVRRALKAAVFDSFSQGSEQRSQSRWLLTSRIVGYEALPFDRYDKFEREGAGYGENVEALLHQAEHLRFAEVRYVAPFSDNQIEQFAHNWYIQHEQAEHERQERARELVDAIATNKGTRSLARIPNLLTLIALIYRVYRWLPDGRALLYDRIAEAYLESIDRFRGLEGLDYSLAQKKRWLAYVGFQMQLRRGKHKDGRRRPRESEQRDILVDADQVHKWIAEAMGTAVEDANASARRFVDYIARRSGLLLPRGEGQFAFTHLSLQEYFAACYCLEQVTAPRWLDGRGRNKLFKPEHLRAYANNRNWRETLILLFEALAERPGWPDDLIECIYGEDFADLANDADRRKEEAALLLADVSLDRHAGLSPEYREDSLVACWRWELVAERKEGRSFSLGRNTMVRVLLAVTPGQREAVWAAFKRATGGADGPVVAETLDLASSSVVDADLAHIAGLADLRMLRLTATQITNAGLKHLSGLTDLQTLYLGTCESITDAGLEHISALANLQSLYLWDTQITDAGLAHLAALTSLQTLHLQGTPITGAGLAHLAALTSLQTLHLQGTPITDAGLEHVAALTNLKSLDLSSCTRITGAGLAHLAALTSLQTLHLQGTSITDAGLGRLSALTGLQLLDLQGTQITDAGLEHLSALTGLRSLDLRFCYSITDAGLKHLSGCTKLESLETRGTKVTEAGRKRFFASLKRGESK